MPELADFSIDFDENNQEVKISGVVRPADDAAAAPLEKCIRDGAASVKGRLYLNLKRLEHMSYAGYRVFAATVLDVLEAHPTLSVTIVISTVVPWASRRFAQLATLSDRLTIDRYDRAFYPGQGVIENDALLPVLRAQTSVIWKHEKPILVRHGLRPGMSVADICCGIGDFASLLWRHFDPERLVAVDHCQPFLDYARAVAHDFDIDGIEYQFGDAASLFLPDDSFDFVSARLALQIFDKPESILAELRRVCKPGGRVYLTNELMGHIHAFPKEGPVSWAYRMIPEMAAELGMDVNFGPKAPAYMRDAGFVDIRVDHMEINNRNSDLRDFAAVATFWRDYVVEEVAAATGQTPEVVARLRSALEDFLYVVESERGFAAWPIYVVSGARPA